MSVKEEKCRKAINFDLDTNRLKEVYPLGEKSYHRAYDDLRKFFEKNGLDHRQGSGYHSKEPLTNANVLDLVGKIQDTFPWIASCIKHIDVTDIGQVYDLKPLFTSTEGGIIPTESKRKPVQTAIRRRKDQDHEL